MGWTVPQSIRNRLIAAGLAAALGGCTVAQRAEALYFQQQRTLAALTTAIAAAEPRDPALADRLYDTEDELHLACAPLWEAGNRRINEREIESELKWQVFQALDSCTEKTREVERLLWQVDPNSAGRYLDGPDDEDRGK